MQGGREACACVCMREREMTKLQYKLKESWERIAAFVGSFSAGNWTVSNRHGTILFLNVKTLRCPYLYVSANLENTAVWLKCKRVNNIRTAEVECSRKWINCCFWRLKQFEQRKNVASPLHWFAFGTFLVVNVLDDGRKVETFLLMKQMWWMTHFRL